MNEISARALPSTDADSVKTIEDYLFTLPQVDVNTTHEISGRIYARTILVPAGTMLVGALHKHDHINVFFGDVTFKTEQGMKRMKGYHVLPTKAGMKRVGYCHGDTAWTTLFHTDLTNVESIEDEMTDESHKIQTRLLKLAKEKSPCLS